MLPTPGIKSTRLDRTAKMKKVVANGNTQRATFGSSTPPAKSSQASHRASIAFCIPVGISFKFHVLKRTMTRISNATIHEQTIEFETGNGPMLNKIGATAETGGTSVFIS